ncbi:hypothetical protein RHMOL_Rhmol06G0278700 [Rhododendron molle]|uniref:Uncharacterized protein n=1 Tax=Rhododendron molle TaxID=49168 RepID=A0ACC0NGW4_RHOML|nr:hypothetical protein RHMOL_Rhmol06G0278700 [Rhododendron molle]
MPSAATTTTLASGTSTAFHFRSGTPSWVLDSCANDHMTGPNLKEQMQWCGDHLEEISKLAKVKAQVSEVKGTMLQDIEKVRKNQGLLVMQILLSAANQFSFMIFM